MCPVTSCMDNNIIIGTTCIYKFGECLLEARGGGACSCQPDYRMYFQHRTTSKISELYRGRRDNEVPETLLFAFTDGASYSITIEEPPPPSA